MIRKKLTEARKTLESILRQFSHHFCEEAYTYIYIPCNDTADEASRVQALTTLQAISGHFSCPKSHESTATSLWHEFSNHSEVTAKDVHNFMSNINGIIKTQLFSTSITELLQKTNQLLKEAFPLLLERDLLNATNEVTQAYIAHNKAEQELATAMRLIEVEKSFDPKSDAKNLIKEYKSAYDDLMAAKFTIHDAEQNLRTAKQRSTRYRLYQQQRQDTITSATESQSAAPSITRPGTPILFKQQSTKIPAQQQIPERPTTPDPTHRCL